MRLELQSTLAKVLDLFTHYVVNSIANTKWTFIPVRYMNNVDLFLCLKSHDQKVMMPLLGEYRKELDHINVIVLNGSKQT